MKYDFLCALQNNLLNLQFYAIRKRDHNIKITVGLIMNHDRLPVKYVTFNKFLLFYYRRLLKFIFLSGL